MRARQRQQQLTSVAEEAEQACSGRHLPHQCTFCSFLLHFCVSAVAAAADVVDVQHVCIIAISGAITVRERERGPPDRAATEQLGEEFVSATDAEKSAKIANWPIKMLSAVLCLKREQRQITSLSEDLSVCVLCLHSVTESPVEDKTTPRLRLCLHNRRQHASTTADCAR